MIPEFRRPGSGAADAVVNFLAAQGSRKRKVKTEAADEVLKRITDVLEEYKAEDIVTIDLAGKSPLADYMVVATGRSQRQVQALTDYVGEAVKVMVGAPKVEGHAQGDWVLIDAGDVVVHIFRPEVREFYNIEAMWSLPVHAPDVGSTLA